jgi:hypothetical protein
MGVDCILIDAPANESIQMALAEGRLFLSADRKLTDKREYQNYAVNCSIEACVNFHISCFSGGVGAWNGC